MEARRKVCVSEPGERERESLDSTRERERTKVK
jgi:hypothetical protein